MNTHYSNQAQSRSSALTVDTYNAQLKYYDDDLEDNPLDTGAIDSGLELSPPMADSRRESLTLGPSIFSPQSVDMQSVPSTNGYEPQGPNPFNMASTGQYMVNNNPWDFVNHPAADATPMQHFDGFHTGMASNTPFASTPMFPNLSQGTADPSMPTSPQNNWVGQANNKRARVADDAVRSHNDLRRGDGIRKKNARFEIPAERNLSNIDQLIALSNDPAELKELKQQKRLLRNRQAALDSRQRKKMHTERLEDEKKSYTVIITQLETQLNELAAQNAQLNADRQHQHQAFMMEREEMIRSHTLETGELRKQNAILKEQLQHMDDMSPPSTAGHAGEFGGLYDNGSGTGWPTSDFVPDFADFADEPEQDIKPDLAQLNKTQEVQAPADKSAPSSGFLFMMFLVGAFVLSSRKPQAIPAVSDDMRAASASLLNSVLKDAGVAAGTATIHQAAPQPSSVTSWADHSADTSTNGMFVREASPSSLLDFGESLTQPPQHQVREHAFSLSAAQYDGITNQDFLKDVTPKPTSEGRRNLADALATMRLSNKHNEAAEVYTRTLLWDQIPRDVVQNFAKMVSTSQSSAHSNDVAA